MQNLKLKESFRWFGPNDTVMLSDIKQVGATGVYTSLHHIPYGDIWPTEEIVKRKEMLAEAGLTWDAVESLPVTEEIKTRSGDYKAHLENYKVSLRNLGKEGVRIVIYNFMPVLDWVRTDLKYKLEDGTECLRFDVARFAAFEIYFLKRAGAEAEYTDTVKAKAKAFYDSMNDKEREEFCKAIIDVFPGCKLGLNIEDMREMLAKYDAITRDVLKENFKLFLEEVIPVAEEAGVVLAVHPDDPPYSILGLSRIVSCEEDVKDLLSMVDSPANGLCLCTGSYSARLDNDIVGMIERYGDRIHAVHMRSTQCDEEGNFYEARHLEGSVKMCEVMEALLNEEKKRQEAGRKDWQLSFRPDHGVLMLDDMSKPPVDNPGYTCIGRMKGLAELRGLEKGLLFCKFGQK